MNMKTTKKEEVAPQVEPVYSITVTLKTDKVVMLFTNKTMAKEEFDRIRAPGIYAGQWIVNITLD
jgi:hypothetical protein